MTPRQSRRLWKRFAEQVEQENSGRPIDPEIASRMTRPAEKAVYQVYVICGGKPTPVGFRADKATIEEFASAIRVQINAGHEKSWSEPLVVRV